MTPAAAPRRYHNLDLYRAVLMVAGVWLHTAIPYFDVPFADGESERFQSMLATFFFLIHLFRMPAFFLLSGFFGAMLWQRRGPGALLWHRVKRIGGPFVLFLPLLWQFMKFAEYLDQAFRSGTKSPEQAALEALSHLPELPDGTLHLWFIYYLLWIHVVVVTVTWCIERSPTVAARLHRIGRRVVAAPLTTVAGIASLHLLWMVGLGWYGIPTANGFLPDPTILAYYTGWFGLGWVLWRLDFRPEDLIGRTSVRRWMGLGTLMTLGAIHLIRRLTDIEESLNWQSDPTELAISLTLIACISLSMLGLVWLSAAVFLRLPDVPRAAGRYLSDASYWIYLLHLPLSMTLPHLFWWPTAPPALHYLGTVLVVFVVCLLSYDTLVRDRWIGVLLNGRRSPAVAPRASLAIVIGATVVAIAVVFQYAQRDHSGWRAPDPSSLIDTPSTFPYPDEPGTPAGGCLKVESILICPGPVAHDEVTSSCGALGTHGDLPWSPAQQATLQRAVPAVTNRAVWVPVRRAAGDEAWRWHNGTEVQDPPFATGEPNGNVLQDYCVVLNRKEREGWVDLPCERMYGFVCLLPDTEEI